MAGRKPFTLIAAAIFAIMTIAHAYRIATGFEVTVGNHSLAMTISYLAVVITGLLAVMLYRESRIRP